jgi:dephospho-CoA kinase
MFVIGLTGGIGTGKSEASQILGELGAVIVDADKVAHEVYEPGSAGWREVVNTFGEGVLDGEGRIDRKRLADIVFADERALEKLNSIVHPKVRQLLDERISELKRQGVEVVVVEVPLLIEAIRQEARWTQMLDEIWVVVAHEDQVVERVRARSGLEEAAIRSRINSQTTQEERIAYADIVIDNSGSLVGLRRQVAKLWHERVPHS